MYILSLYFSLWLWKHNHLSLFPILMSFSRGLNQSFESCWSLQPFTLGLRRRLWLWIQLRIFELSFRFHLLCTQRFACRLARREFHPTSPPLRLLLFGMFTNRIMDWFHLLFFLYVEATRFFSCESLTLTITPGLRLDSELQKKLLYISLRKSWNNQREKKKNNGGHKDSSIITNIRRP